MGSNALSISISSDARFLMLILLRICKERETVNLDMFFYYENELFPYNLISSKAFFAAWLWLSFFVSALPEALF